MDIGFFDLFSIGIGPSSSHTVGPMRAANDFVKKIKKCHIFNNVERIKVELYGSLALTGVGHGTDKAIVNGLEGKTPESIDPNEILPRLEAISRSGALNLSASKSIKFHKEKDLLFHQKKLLPKHTNGMCFTAYDAQDETLLSEVYYSIGGGFIVTDKKFGKPTKEHIQSPYSFSSAEGLLELCKSKKLTIAELMMKQECYWHSLSTVKTRIKRVAQIMLACIERGCSETGVLPGGLQVKRRAPELYQKLMHEKTGVQSVFEHSDILNRLNVYAMAVNEENAAGGRIVTAPTNGAAGIIPAVLKYYQEAYNRYGDEDLYCYFLTATAIGILYKKGASISGAEVGCQGEVGVASSMAAAGITAVLGGTLEQIENAAEIAMEHHLGLTCDPIMGLVQIPCIERNAMGAVKAVNASRMALMGDGQHHVPLDKVIRTMKQTGKDMMTIYKETSLGGLAVNLPEC